MTSDKIRALVVEDEPNSQYALIKLIERYCPNVKVVGAVFTVEELLEELQVKEVDVLFLDINLGKKSAFEALLRVRTRNFQIIVTTAHRHHALKAFEHRAVHFLLKPVATEELIESVARLRTHHQGINGDSLKKLSGLASPQKKLAIPDVSGFEMVTEDDLLKLEGEGAYTNIYLKNSEKRMVSKSLGYFEGLLNPSVFIRIHKKYIVNMNEISRMNRGVKSYLVLSSGDTVPVSRSRKNEVFSRII